MGLVIGTRPEAIKLAPVAAALARADAPPSLYLTGQHPGLDRADHDLGRFAAVTLGCIGRSDPLDHVDEVAAELERCWRRDPPELVMVQGDTSSALGGARAAQRCGLPVAHVEAGLRTFDPRSPWPEEQFRTEIDRGAALLFAPTATAAANLRRERCTGALHVTGNSGIDAMMAQLANLPRTRRRARRHPLKLLVTCHRRENWGSGLSSLASALVTLARRGDAAITIVLHPNPHVAEAMWSLLGAERAIRLITPLGHASMIEAMRAADLILSDSGGVQEEAPGLGVPLLVLREKTERPECIASGNALLVGTDAERLIAAVTRLLGDPAALAAMAVPRFPFGDGHAAPRIVALALAWLDSRREDERGASADRLIDRERGLQHRAPAPPARYDGPFV
ncbi:MAG: UDP-N-acetylglucosamine 2-epimerase (non-hydrolyzing) [Pseudomonadota bacterium]|nr:UDP-N-acetylglucosamine 2-epimerase (non-hydrolyzing) [Pseudomonadota bacterium]